LNYYQCCVENNMDRIALLEAFVHVAKSGSFTQAAERLDMSVQLVSKYVTHLEQRLDARLLNRTTRRNSLTETGQRYLVRAQQLLNDFESMDSEVHELQESAAGTLRIAAPVSFAIRHLSSCLDEFLKQHPKVDIDLQLNDRRVDIVEEGFDIALRIGQLQDSLLIAKHLTPIRLVLCASPQYLQREGEPDTPQALASHQYLHYSLLTSAPENLWPALDKSRHNQHRQFQSNNGDVLLNMALAGHGIAMQPTFICGHDIASGNLKVVLPDYAPPATHLYAVYAHRQLVANKVRAFIDFAAQYYGETPYWDNWNL
jgi:DNA-binding transcriptional LysR family regulator